MPKQKTDDLIQLIRSLSRAEKRHFRLFVKRNQASEDILFLQLFDFLEKRGEYEESLILKKLEGVKKRQLSNLKAHLYKQLLVSLRLLSTKNVPDIQLREMLDYARVLYDKGLYRQSLEVLDKTKTKAREAHFHAIHLEALEFEKHIEGQYITRSIEGRADMLAEESRELQNAVIHSQVFGNLALQMYGWYLKVGYVRNDLDFQRARAYFFEHLPKTSYESLDFISKVYYCQAHVWYFYMTQQFAYCYRHAQNWVDLFLQEPEMIRLHTSLYLKGLHNLLNALFNVLHYDKAREVLELLLRFPEEHPLDNLNVESLFHMFKYINLIKLHFMEGTFSEGVRILPELIEIIEEDRYNWDDHRIMTFYYRIACMYFGAGDNDSAITWLNRIINQRNPDYRADIQCFARILNLICHYELGNAQLVEYQVKSVYRFLAKMEDLGAVHQAIFRFLRKLTRIQESELPGAFRSLIDKLTSLKGDPLELRPFLYLDIISWLESKLEERPVQEVIRDKYLARKARMGKTSAP